MQSIATSGKDPTPESIHSGTVRMEQHPQYQEVIRQVKEIGFKIKINDEARIEVIEVLDSNGDRIRVDKILYVQENMRYLDLEHEFGHIKQLERFGDKMLLTHRVIERFDGILKNAPSKQGLLTVWQNAIIEYHNRLEEFICLYERGVSYELLKEHQLGVELWRQAYLKKGLKNGRSPTQRAWVLRYFPDISQLQSRYFKIVEILE